MQTGRPMSRPLPVDRPITADMLLTYTPEELVNRPILHPDFAGFDPDFRYYEHVLVSLDGEANRMVTETLEQLAQTPEGQQLMRQASALNKIKSGAPAVLIANPPPEIAPESSHYNPRFGWLKVDYGQVMNSEYQTTDGQWMDFSIQRTVIHELFHAANPDITQRPEGAAQPSHYTFLAENNYRLPSEGAGLWGVWQWRLNNTERMVNDLMEGPITGETNRLMEKYYGEDAARMNHRSWRNEQPTDALKTTQENLGADHFYDEINIETPDVPNQKPVDRNR